MGSKTHIGGHRKREVHKLEGTIHILEHTKYKFVFTNKNWEIGFLHFTNSG
jgi:hypothetical protein